MDIDAGWVCHVCQARNSPAVQACPACGATAIAAGGEVEAAQAITGSGGEPLLAVAHAQPEYGTFWQRFGASLVDELLFVPLSVAQIWLEGGSKELAFVLTVPMGLAFYLYVIYCHGRFGQTLGKYLAGIRVVRLNGDALGWRDAFLRSSVDLVFEVLGIVSVLIALSAIPEADYYGVGWWQRAENITDLQPASLAWTSAALQIWGWSEIVVMLFNKRRRALHDFIAGTIVIKSSRPWVS
jgi:uncharacterized RDD family membrane protein YckC